MKLEITLWMNGYDSNCSSHTVKYGQLMKQNTLEFVVTQGTLLSKQKSRIAAMFMYYHVCLLHVFVKMKIIKYAWGRIFIKIVKIHNG